jgi:hypothetical protein
MSLDPVVMSSVIRTALKDMATIEGVIRGNLFSTYTPEQSFRLVLEHVYYQAHAAGVAYEASRKPVPPVRIAYSGRITAIQTQLTELLAEVLDAEDQQNEQNSGK